MTMMMPTNSNGIISTTNDHDHRRIVFLPGPHKTSSSSVQFNLCQWLYESEQKNENADPNVTNDMKAVVKGGLQKHWTMPIPDEVFRSSNRGCFKVFGTLASVLTVTNVQCPHTEQL